MSDTQEPPPADSLPQSALPPRPSLGRRIWDFPLTRIVAYGLLTLGITLTLGIVSLAVLLMLHVPQRVIVSPSEGAKIFGECLFLVGAMAAFWVMVRFADKRPWATAGFTRREMLPQTMLGFAIGAAMITIGVGALALLGVYRITGVGPFAPVLPSVLFYLSVGIFEETFFRGYIFQTLETRWGSGLALVVSGLLFGLTHLNNSVHGVSPLERLAGPAFICLEAGLPLGAAYLLTRRWWLPIGIHWAWDFFEGPIFGLHDSGSIDPHALLHSHVSGPFLVTGGPFGPEAGLVFLATGTLAGVFLLRLAIRNGQWQLLPRRASHVPGTDPQSAGSAPSV
jgi:membrane protease YdiL (CAAX protease family)